MDRISLKFLRTKHLDKGLDLNRVHLHRGNHGFREAVWKQDVVDLDSKTVSLVTAYVYTDLGAQKLSSFPLQF
jgi:hypothetical protein